MGTQVCWGNEVRLLHYASHTPCAEQTPSNSESASAPISANAAGRPGEASNPFGGDVISRSQGPGTVMGLQSGYVAFSRPHPEFSAAI